jgi:hypothetical protein
MADTQPRFGWPSGWRLITRDGRSWVTCFGGCAEDRGHEVVALPDPAEVIEAIRPVSDSVPYLKPDGGLTPEWVIQQDVDDLKKVVTRYFDHIEAFEAAGVHASVGSEEGEQR